MSEELDVMALEQRLGQGPSLWLCVSKELLAWCQAYPEDVLLDQLVQLITAGRPIASPNIMALAGALNPGATVERIAARFAHATTQEQEHQELINCLHWLLCLRRHCGVQIGAAASSALFAALEQPATSKRWWLLSIMGYFGDPQLFDTALPYIHDRDSELQVEALPTLIRLDAERSVSLIADMLPDADETARWAICETLTECPTLSAVPLLIEVLRRDPSPHVRVAAAFALGVAGDPRALPVLADAAVVDRDIDYGGHTVAFTAARGIVCIQLQRLQRAVRDHNRNAFEGLWTAESIGQMRAAEAWGELQRDGVLQHIAPVSYFVGGDVATYFEALKPRFVMRAVCTQEGTATERNVTFQRIGDAWLIDAIECCGVRPEKDAE